MSDDIGRLGVFQIFTGDGTGTGFLVRPDVLLTNCHVVAPYRQVAVELRDRSRVLGTVRRIHPERDLAIVEIGQPLTEHVLALSPQDALAPEQSLRILGFPIGLPLSVTEGVVSNPDQLYDGQHYVQTDAALDPGNSGGPMLDEGQAVVAVTTRKLTSADNVGFGIPVADVRTFVEGFGAQTAPFGVVCPACDALLESAARYCANCGSDLEELKLGLYFEPQDAHPVAAFVERALASAHIDPVLARHGARNWSFHAGSAPIKIWCRCSEHLCFSSPLATVSKHGLEALFRYLLSPEHAPLAFDLEDNVIRLNLTFHMSDVFDAAVHGEATAWITRFIADADRYDNLLLERFGCTAAAETQLTFLAHG